MRLQTSDIQRKLLNGSILLTGAPRSGTTLLGKLISTFKGIEYHFEPPSLYMIASSYVANTMPLDVAVNLLTIYLCEDLLLESVHGRSVNLRPNDDSLVLNRMSWNNLNERWKTVSNRNDAITMIQKQGLRLAVKMPNLFDSYNLMKSTLPNMYTVISVRNGVDVIRSIICKGWVSRDGLSRDLWPYRGVEEGINIPYWVTDEYKKRWARMNQETRACLMWTHHAELGLNVVTENQGLQIHKVRYEELLVNPLQIIDELAEALGSETTFYTRKWIETVCIPKSMRERKMKDFITKIDADIRDRFEKINTKWGY